MLDTACARVAIGLNTRPPALEAATRQIGDIDREIKILEREALIGRDHAERLSALAAEREVVQARLEALTRNWEAEMEIANRIREARQEIQALHEKVRSDTGAMAPMQEILKGLEKELAEVQGDNPLVQIAVDSEIISPGDIRLDRDSDGAHADR